MQRFRFILAVSATSLFAVFFVGIVYAGSLSPSASPAATSYTLTDIYNRLTTNATATEAAHDFAPTGSPASSLYTLKQVYEAIPTIVASTIKRGISYLGVTGTYSGYPGTGWTPNPSGDGSTALNQANCEAAAGWHWFADGNADGDTTDPEDGICVQGTDQILVATGSWNGNDYYTWRDNSYISAYTCSGNFPSGTVATYSGIDSVGSADNTWNVGDCALCQADCYDGKKDLPGQGTFTTPNASGEGPITPEVLKNWKGTRLPTLRDSFGYCGYKNGYSAGTDNYETSCSSDITHGDYGQMIGRTDMCIDISNSGAHEWVSEQFSYNSGRTSGLYSCLHSNSDAVSANLRFRAVYRP